MTDVRLIRCRACGATNRVPTEKLGHSLEPVCGRCKTPLAVDAKPITVTDGTFAADVERSPLPVLLDMWATWCGPCKILAPVIEELAVDLAGRVRVGKLDVDENPATAARFGVRSHSDASCAAGRPGARSHRGCTAQAGDRTPPHARAGLKVDGSFVGLSGTEVSRT